MARLIPVPDVGDGRGAVASGVVHWWYRGVPSGGTGSAQLGIARTGVCSSRRYPCPAMLEQGTTMAFDGRAGRLDRLGRALRDLRISITDRCNFRCPYCMPSEVFGRDYQFLPARRDPALRGDPPAGPRLRRARRAQAADHGRRADGPARPAGPRRDARRAAHRRRRAGRPRPDDERLGAARPRAPARRRRPAPGHRLARLARRRRCSGG